MAKALKDVENEKRMKRQIDHLEDIKHQESTCYELENKYESAKANAASAKKRWEESVCKP